MQARRLNTGVLLMLAVAVLAVSTMIWAIHLTTKAPTTPGIDPKFARSKLNKPTRAMPSPDSPAPKTPEKSFKREKGP